MTADKEHKDFAHTQVRQLNQIASILELQVKGNGDQILHSFFEGIPLSKLTGPTDGRFASYTQSEEYRKFQNFIENFLSKPVSRQSQRLRTVARAIERQFDLHKKEKS